MAAAKAKNELAVVDNFDLQTISGDLAQAIACLLYTSDAADD